MGDKRLREIIKLAAKSPQFSLIGFGSDIGTIKNGGRGGAKKGPKILFDILKKSGPLINPELNIDISSLSIKECLITSTHQQLYNIVSKTSKNTIPIILGGSNDQSFTNAKGLLDNYPNLDVINIDAHLDVRPGKGHSGSPFQELLNYHKFVGEFNEFACQGNQCSAEHAAFAKKMGTKLHWLSKIKHPKTYIDILASRNNPLFVSFDIDSIRAADCPGVSCPSTRGITAEQALDLCFLSGSCPRVVGIDISEFNPLIENNITPRLVAQMVYHFLLGYQSSRSIH